MFAARPDYLFFTSIVYGLAACATSAGSDQGASGAPAPAVGAAANGGAGTAAVSGAAAASPVPGTSTGTVAMAGAAAAAPTGANAAGGAGALATAGAAGVSAMSSAAGGASMLPASSGGAGAAGTGAAAAGGATFTEVFNLLAGGCATGGYCHASGGGLSKLELVDQTKSYMALVATPAMGMAMPGAMAMGCSTSMIIRVKAGDPDNSLLMQKLEGKETCGTEMPPNGMLRPEELKLVRDWIQAGAKND